MNRDPWSQKKPPPDKASGGDRRSVLVRQKERRHAPVGLRDDPERIFAKALARLLRVNRIGGQDAKPVLHGVVIGLPVLAANAAPIADGMTLETVKPLLVGRRCQRSLGGDDLPEVEARTAGNEDVLGHDENSFGDVKKKPRRIAPAGRGV